MAIHLEPESSLLREILRPRLDMEGIEKLVSSNNWFDWDRFEEVLFRSRLVPLASVTVSRHEGLAGLLPESIRQRLLVEEERAAVRSLLKGHELGQILDRFHDCGIHQIILKGTPFAERYFGDPAYRDVRDLDMLIPPEQLRSAERVLQGLGYELFEAVHSREHYRRHHFHVVYVRRSKTIDVVELHWNLLRHPYSLSVHTADLFREAEPYEIEGRGAKLLSAVDEMVYVIASLRSAHFASLRRLVDLDRAMRKLSPGLAPEKVWDRAREWGMGDEALAGFHIMHRFWGEERYALPVTRRIAHFASRYHGSDFFGLTSGREMRLRMWCAAFFGKWSLPDFGRQILFPDEDAGAELYYSKESERSGMKKVRRIMTGLASLVDLSANLAVAPFRRMR